MWCIIISIHKPLISYFQAKKNEPIGSFENDRLKTTFLLLAEPILDCSNLSLAEQSKVIYFYLPMVVFYDVRLF